MSEERVVYYRYEDQRRAGSEDGDPSRVYIYLLEYPLIKKTAKGARINYYGKSKFILASAHLPFALPTIEEAKEVFLKRKTRQHQNLRQKMADVEYAYKLVKEMKPCQRVPFGDFLEMPTDLKAAFMQT